MFPKKYFEINNFLYLCQMKAKDLIPDDKNFNKGTSKGKELMDKSLSNFWDGFKYLEKKCYKCGETKPITEFYKNKSKKDNLDTDCKDCKKEYKTQYYKKNKNQIDKKNKDNYIIKIDERKEYQKKYRYENKEKIKACKKKCYNNNKEAYKEQNQKYNIENKEKIKNKKRDYHRKKRQTDVNYRIECNLRNRLWYAVTNINTIKDKSTLDILGCDVETYKNYLQEKFKKGMSFDNYGEWHIDHIIPLCNAKNKEELEILFHYKNTQPLWAKDNLEKNKYTTHQQLKKWGEKRTLEIK